MDNKTGVQMMFWSLLVMGALLYTLSLAAQL